MLDYPQDAYNLAKERQFEYRERARKEKIIQVSVTSNGKKISTSFKEWLSTLNQLRKVRLEIQFIIKRQVHYTSAKGLINS